MESSAKRTLKERWEQYCDKNKDGPFYKYCVDVASGWTYYTPLYALQEFASGKDLETIVKTRLIGLVAHSIAMRPTGLARDYVAKKLNVTKDSPLKDKIKVNVISVTPIQLVVYAGMVIGGMAWSGNYDWKSSTLAWVIGVGVGAAHSLAYGPFQDKFRNSFGIPPAINKK